MAIQTMVWATRAADGTAVHVLEVEAGLACACLCPGCRAVLEAVNSRNPQRKRRPHFRHYAAPELEDCTVVAALAAARAAIAQLDSFETPVRSVEGRAESVDGRVFSEVVSTAAAVQPVTRYAFVDMADAVLTLADGQQVYVRLAAHSPQTHDLEPKQQAIPEIVIDIADPALQGFDRETLRRYIALSPTGRVWCNNQALQLQADRLAAHKAQAYDVSRPAPPSSFLRPGAVEDRSPAGPLRAQPSLYRDPAAFAWCSADAPVRINSAEVLVWRGFYKNGAYRLYAPRLDSITCCGMPGRPETGAGSWTRCWLRGGSFTAWTRIYRSRASYAQQGSFERSDSTGSPKHGESGCSGPGARAVPASGTGPGGAVTMCAPMGRRSRGSASAGLCRVASKQLCG